MADILILMTSICLIAIVGRLLGRELLSRRHLIGFSSSYSRTALRLERMYKLFAFVILQGMLVFALVTSLIQLIGSDPF